MRRLPSIIFTSCRAPTLELLLHQRLKPGGFQLPTPLRPHRLVDQFDEPGPVDQLDRVFGDELLRRQRKRAGGDKEALVAPGMMDRPKEFLKIRRANHPFLVVLALNDGQHPVPTAEPEVGPLVTCPADRLDLEAHGLKKFRGKFLKRLGRQRGKLRQFQIGPLRLAVLVLDPLTSLSNRLAKFADLDLVASRLLRIEPSQVSIHLEECVIDGVIQPGSLGASQLVLITPVDGILQVLQRPGQFGGRSDGRRILLIGGRFPEKTLAVDARGDPRIGLTGTGGLGLDPFEQHRGALRTEALHRYQPPLPSLRSQTIAPAWRIDRPQTRSRANFADRLMPPDVFEGRP